MAATLAELRARRAQECRLTKDRALASLEEAEAFLRDRRIVTQTQDSSLPSLFTAIHEPPYAPGKSGFGSWPRTKWWWGAELGQRPSVQPLKIHKGKLVLLSAEAAMTVDPLCRDSLSRAEDGELGPDAAAILRSLDASGPRGADAVRTDTGLTAAAFRSAREKLEREGAVVARPIVRPELRSTGAPAPAASPAPDEPHSTVEIEGHRHSATLARWDQSHTQRRKASLERALEDLVLLGIRAAVVVQEDEPREWFVWPVARDTIRKLRETGRLVSPAAGWVAAS